MTLIFYKAAAAIVIFLISIVTAAYPIRKRASISPAESIEMGEALASGIFLGAAFFHMLPDAIKSFDHLYGTLTYPVPEAVCVAGFLLLLSLERLSLSQSNRHAHSLPYLLALIFIIHAVAEGIALGLGISFSETLLIFVAILAHKASESFALAIALLRHQLPNKHLMAIVVTFALMTPLGIALGTTVNTFSFIRSGELTYALFNAFTAGTFLYISTLHHVHFHKHTRGVRGLLEFASLVFGCVMMGVIAMWA